MYLNELLKVLGVGLTPATILVVGYFLYRDAIVKYVDLKKEFEEMREDMEKAYMRRDVNEEKLKSLENTNNDLQRQIDGNRRWLEKLSRNHIK